MYPLNEDGSCQFCGSMDPELYHLGGCIAALRMVPSDIIFPAKPLAGNPKFHSHLAKMAEMHDKKSADYANNKNYYQNFEEAARTAGVTVDEVFMTLIGIKLARLRELIQAGKQPSNESIQDSRLDLSVYSALWASYHETTS